LRPRKVACSLRDTRRHTANGTRWIL